MKEFNFPLFFVSCHNFIFSTKMEDNLKRKSAHRQISLEDIYGEKAFTFFLSVLSFYLIFRFLGNSRLYFFNEKY